MRGSCVWPDLAALPCEARRCPICMEQRLGSVCVRLPDCDHTACRSCFAQYCSIKVRCDAA